MNNCGWGKPHTRNLITTRDMKKKDAKSRLFYAFLYRFSTFYFDKPFTKSRIYSTV